MESLLPFDTIAIIIDFLIKDDVKGLQDVKACSLVCQSFLPLCRTHIFSSIEIKLITGKRQPHNTEAFGRLLQETPEIARSIRQLNVVIANPRSESGNLFNQIPQRLTRLQSLTFSRPDDVHEINWNKVSLTMQRSLLNLMHLPTINHLKLGWIKNFPLSDLITCTNLKRLSAEALYLVIGKHDNSASSLSHEPMRLQELDIKIFSSLDGLSLLTARHSDGQTLLDFSGLEKISLVFFVPQYAIRAQEILRMSQQLTEVRLAVSDEVFPEIGFAKAVTPSLQTLKRIHFTFNINEESEDPLAGLCQELEEISGKNVLESIEIVVDIQTSEDCHTGDTWGRLEKVLLQPGWPMLKHASLAIIVHRENNSPFRMAIERLPDTQFPGLMSSKDFDFQFSIRQGVLFS